MTKKSASVKFIFVTVFLEWLGLGIIIPILPDVIRRFGAEPEFVNHYFGYFVSVYALMQLIASPVLGSLSDNFGRRPVLLVSLLGAGLDYILMAFSPSLLILFVGRIISGLTGAGMTVASSYMADISDDSNRSANFGMIGAGFGLGFIIGPVIGGMLGSHGFQVPFLFAAVLNIINFGFGLFILPESLPPEKRRPFKFKFLNPITSVLETARQSKVGVLFLVYFLFYLSGQVHPSIWTLYTQLKFHWTAFDVGLSLAAVGLTIAIVQGGLTRVIIPKIGESRAVLFGSWFTIIGFMLYAFATEGWMIYAIMPFSCLSGIAGPALQSLISKRTPPSQQGELQGCLMSIASLTAILGPLFYTGVFAHFTMPSSPIFFPGVAYFMAALVSLIGWILLMVKKSSVLIN
jgi:DHA1 family tetracycline resistance protein-like MFS transporter